MVHGIIDAVKVADATIPRATLQGIQVASAQSGVSFQYLLAKAAQESGLDKDAGASTSSAKGLFQFTKGTWLDVVKRHAEDLGLGDLAQRILSAPNGRLSVLDKSTERTILNLRQDPEVSALAAAAYARDNADAISTVLGRDPDATELYLAHFLGASGASTMLTTFEDAPNIYASHVLPAAAKANPSVFFTEAGAPRTVGEVVALIRGRFEKQMDRFGDVASALAAGETENSIAPGPAARGVSNAFAASPPNIVRQPSDPFDMRAAVDAKDPQRMSISWYLMEELARMIAAQPMSMLGTDDEAGDDQSLPSTGFGGNDWSSTILNNMSERAGLPTATPSRGARAYIKAVGA